MRAGAMHHASGVRHPKPVVVRVGLACTFGGLAGFVVVIFLCGAIDIRVDVFSNPIEAGAAPVISAAFIIALAAMLLSFLIKPRKRPRTTSHQHCLDSAAPATRPSVDPVDRAEQQGNVRNNLPYQRFYFDHSRIRPYLCLMNQARGMAVKERSSRMMRCFICYPPVFKATPRPLH